MSYYSNGGGAEISSWVQSAMNALPTEMQQSISSEIARASQSIAQAAGKNSASSVQPVTGVAVAVSAVLVAAAGLLMWKDYYQEEWMWSRNLLFIYSISTASYVALCVTVNIKASIKHEWF